MVEICRRYLVSGRVQGVWFRDSTRREAQTLGLVGHAVNLPDGRVEVVACGDTAAVDALQRWLQQGPPGARVDQLQVFSSDPIMIDGFHIGNAPEPGGLSNLGSH